MRKKTVEKILLEYNLPYASRSASTHSITMENYTCTQFIKIVTPIIDSYNKEARKTLLDIFSKFFNKIPSSSQDERLMFLYDVLLKLQPLAMTKKENATINMIKKHRPKFTINSDYYVLTVQVIIELYQAVLNSKLVLLSTITEKLGFSLKELRYIKPILKEILKIQPIYFNNVRLDLSVEKNPLRIPMAVQKVLKSFEIHLREFLIKKILTNMNSPIEDYFPRGMFKKAKSAAIWEMKKSKTYKSDIDRFRHSNFRNKADLLWIFEQLGYSDYIKIISHNFHFLVKYFGNRDYKNELKKIGQFRNIWAHIKTEAERNISQHLELLYIYERIFQSVLIDRKDTLSL
ncbi:MAG: hypothetical protein ACFFC7_31180 [Candidatus Hermodarchaeota archaeon]